MAENPLRDVVRREAESAGVDPDLAVRIVDAENNGPNWKTGLRSGKGAMGLMQLMPATAQAYGVKNPYDPLQNIKGGIALLKDLSQKYPGRPDLIAAAYNAGEPAVNKAGGVPDFPETKAYVDKVDPFSRYAVTEPKKDDPFARYVVADETQKKDTTTKQKTTTTPAGGDEIVGLRTDPQARAERINRNLEQQQAITRQTLLAMPASGEALAATLRGAGAATSALGRSLSGLLPRAALEAVAHYTGMGIPGYIAAGVAPEVLQAAGKTSAAAGRGLQAVLGRAPTVAAEAAPAAETVAPLASEGPGGLGWYKPWEGAERARIVEGTKPLPGYSNVATKSAPASTIEAQAPAASGVWKAMDTMGVRLRADEMPRATQLVRGGMAPEKAIGQVLKERGAIRATNIQEPAAELQRQLGTQTNAEAAARMRARAFAGEKSLMDAYGGEEIKGPLGVK